MVFASHPSANLLLVALRSTLRRKASGDDEEKILTVRFVRDNKYEGEFKNAKKHGQGTMTFPDGSKQEGKWEDDNPTGPLKPTLPGGFTYKRGVLGSREVTSPLVLDWREPTRAAESRGGAWPV